MAIDVKPVLRAFWYGGIELPDPGPQFTPVQVRDLYTNTYGELALAAVEGPNPSGNAVRYDFVKAVRDKG